MMKKVLTLTLVATLLGSAALASAFYRNRTVVKQENTQTLTEVKVCPINGERVDDEDSPTEVVGNYKVYFCCSHHQEEFNKLPQKEKEQKIAKALAKQNKRP